MDSGRIVSFLARNLDKKYTNLEIFMDFLALHNPSQNTIMKVRERCYSGMLVDTP